MHCSISNFAPYHESKFLKVPNIFQCIIYQIRSKLRLNEQFQRMFEIRSILIVDRKRIIITQGCLEKKSVTSASISIIYFSKRTKLIWAMIIKMGKIATVFPIVKSICLGYADFLFLRYTYNIDKGKFLKLLLFLFILNFILLKLKSRFKIQLPIDKK